MAITSYKQTLTLAIKHALGPKLRATKVGCREYDNQVHAVVDGGEHPDEVKAVLTKVASEFQGGDVLNGHLTDSRDSRPPGATFDGCHFTLYFELSIDHALKLAAHRTAKEAAKNGLDKASTAELEQFVLQRLRSSKTARALGGP